MTETKDLIQKLRERNFSYQKIGDMVGLSRQRIHQLLTGYKSPASKVTKSYIRKIHCNICGKKMRSNLRGKYCCPKCKKIIDVRRIPVDWIPNGEYVRGGIKLDGRDFLKEIVRRRDNHTCQICGKKWREGERRLDVHHLDEELGGKNGYKYENCKDFDRQITLCHKCHLGLDDFRKKMSLAMKKVVIINQ